MKYNDNKMKLSFSKFKHQLIFVKTKENLRKKSSKYLRKIRNIPMNKIPELPQIDRC